MANIFDWSGTASSNTTVNGTNIATGMSPGNVDNALREIMAGCANSLAPALETFLAGTDPLPAANGGTGTTAGVSAAAAYSEATTAQVRAATADKLLVCDTVWGAADYVALTDGATIAVDMSAGFNFSVTLGGNRTLGAPTNTKNGQSGVIVLTQDGTGSRTLAYHANWKFAGGNDPTLSTAAGAVDLLFYQVISSTSIYATLVKGIA